MFHRSVRVFTPKCVQTRGMATLKDIRLRLKSITNIQKITKSMKMVSAAKFARAERELRVARPYGQGASAFFEKVEAKRDETQPNHIIIAVTSDRGLCGAVHSSVIKAAKAAIAGKKDGIETKLVLIGDKAKTMLRKLYADQILLTVQEIGKKSPTFQDASRIAEYVMASDYKFNYGSLFYNVFRSVVSYRTKEMPLFSVDSISQAEKLPNYDSLDEEILQCYNEFALATLVYFALKESATSEQSSRMTAMDSASKNAGEMIDKLTLTFNRTRQAVITKELIEIISGAAAL